MTVILAVIFFRKIFYVPSILNNEVSYDNFTIIAYSTHCSLLHIQCSYDTKETAGCILGGDASGGNLLTPPRLRRSIMFYCIIGGLAFLAVLFLGAIATMLLPILAVLVIIAIALWKILAVLTPAAPEVVNQTAEVVQQLSSFFC